MPIHNQIQPLELSTASENNWILTHDLFSLLIKARAHCAAGPTCAAGSEVRSYGARYFQLPFSVDDFDKLSYYWQNNSIQLAESAQQLLNAQAHIETVNGQLTHYDFEGFFYHFGQYNGKEIFLANGQKSTIECFDRHISIITQLNDPYFSPLSYTLLSPYNALEGFNAITQYYVQ